MLEVYVNPKIRKHSTWTENNNCKYSSTFLTNCNMTESTYYTAWNLTLANANLFSASSTTI